MTTQVFATKQKMTQAWTKLGKRVAVTQLTVVNNVVIDQQLNEQEKPISFDIGYGKKKLKNVDKPLRARLEKSGFSIGVQHVRQVEAQPDSQLKPGDIIDVGEMLSVGDVVKVQGVTKGRGFAGAMKRHGFSGQQKTHGQSDRARAVGSIGQRTTPGRVFRGKKMPGHYGVDAQTVLGLTVLHVDAAAQTIWLSGPVPGHMQGMVRITKTGEKKKIELDQKASGIVQPAPAVEIASTAAADTTVTQDGGAQ